MSSSEYELKNVSEDLISVYIDDCMKSVDMCMCNRCRADVMAYALNNFLPKYVVSDIGDILARAMSLSIQYQADIISALMKGVMVVKDKPRHADYKIEVE